MIKVITYGTYDLLHYGHIRLLERARALGDYLIVGVTADDYDKTRGKINVQQSLMERIEAVKATGLADEIIVEEYEGQKIDDIRRYDVDIFTVGSDWIGKFDYLKEYCQVVYLDRTEGISSSELRGKKRAVSLGLVGDSVFLNKVEAECGFVNGLEIAGICTGKIENMSENLKKLPLITDDYGELLDHVDAVYIHSHPVRHYAQIKEALGRGRHVLCESPMTLSRAEYREVRALAEEKGCILMEALKTAYATAYLRLLLLVKAGKIGEVASVDAVCTSLADLSPDSLKERWNSICDWGPTALLPIFQLLGTDYREKKIVSRLIDEKESYDAFTKIDFLYSRGTASLKVGKGVKSEGELVISGTKGYVYVPAPWWKTDYFEIRYENPAENRRYFYQLDGEGIRYELVAFVRSLENGRVNSCMEPQVSEAIAGVMEDFYNRKDMKLI